MSWCSYDLHCCVKNGVGIQKIIKTSNENLPCPTTFDWNATELENLSGSSSAGGVWVMFLNNVALYLVVTYKYFVLLSLKARYAPRCLIKWKLVLLSVIKLYQMILLGNLIVQLSGGWLWGLLDTSFLCRIPNVLEEHTACIMHAVVAHWWNVDGIK